MSEIRNEYADILIKTAEMQEQYKKDSKKIKNIKELEDYKEKMLAESLKLPEVSRDFIATKLNEDLELHIEEMRIDNASLLTKEKMEKKNDESTKAYMEFSKKTKMPDVAFELTSTYAGGTASLKKIVEELNEKDACIEIIYDRHVGRDASKPFGGHDSDLLLIMPASSYAKFNEEIHKDQENTQDLIIGERQECFFINHLNEDLNRNKLKEEIKDAMENGRYGISAFNKRSALGYSEIYGSNYHSNEKIFNGVKRVLSQINALEYHNLKEDGYRQQTVSDIMTSSLVYGSDSGSLEGSIVTPLKEAKRFKNSYEPKIEVKNDDNKKRIRRRPK